uniref:Uncharacterized protein n=1 Tax=Molossus molossus TaxID=27622 RepID=A0A7J8BYM3_MOLMO|nr:hypothetical protein HJG59_010089 [Molossus molossus]
MCPCVCAVTEAGKGTTQSSHGNAETKLEFLTFDFLLFDWKGFCVSRAPAHEGDWRGDLVLWAAMSRGGTWVTGRCLGLTPGVVNQPPGSHFSCVPLVTREGWSRPGQSPPRPGPSSTGYCSVSSLMSSTRSGREA